MFADRNQDAPSVSQARATFSGPRLFALLLLPAIAAILAVYLGAAGTGLFNVAMGMGVGVLAAVVAESLDRGPNSIAPLALGVAAAAVMQVLNKDSREATQLGLAIGLGAASWMLSSGGVARGASRAAVIAIAAVAGDALGARAESFDAAAMTGSAFALATVVAGLVAQAVAGKSSQATLRTLFAVALLGGGGVLVGKQMMHSGDAWIIFLLAMVTGLVVHLLVGPDDKPDSFRFLLAALVWLGAATASFSIDKGYGMATALVGAVSVPLLLGNPRALLSLGPLASLVFYRLFREHYTDATKSIDIGQHYALIGLGLGIVVPLLPIEWRDSQRAEGARGAVAGLLWTILVLGTPLVAAVILGPKGVIGLIFGLGFASIVEGLRGGLKLETLTLGIAATAATVVSYGWLEPLLELERAQKSHHLIIIAIVVAVISLLIFALSYRRARTETP